MNNWLNIIQNKLLKPHCILCGSHSYLGLDICKGCFINLPVNHFYCYRCGESFVTETAKTQYCGRCITEPPNFDQTLAPYVYDGSIRYLVTRLKFAQQFPHARLLAHLLLQHIDTLSDKPECLIPMPLHPNRYRERQFNQSIELARHMSKQLDIPMDLYNCIRVRDTDHQMGLSSKQRQKNMRSAFSVKKPLNVEHVAIVDDVLTTGATASALALALKQQGVKRVDVWVCARA